MKRVLVTGAYGFIARYVAEQLKSLDYYTIGTSHHSDKKENFSWWNEIYYVDVRDASGMMSAIEHSDGVIHLAGLLGTTENMRQSQLLNDVNIGGALNVLNACENFGIPCVLIGVGNHFENNPYSISKTTAERYGLMYAKYFQAKVNVVRALNAFGKRQKWGKIKKIIPTFINHAIRNEPITVYGGKENCSNMDMVYAGDVAKILIDVLEKTSESYKGQTFEAGTGIGYKVWDIAQMIIDLSGSKSELVGVPMRLGESPGSDVVAKNPYPIKYTDIKDVLLDAIQYYKSEMEENE